MHRLLLNIVRQDWSEVREKRAHVLGLEYHRTTALQDCRPIRKSFNMKQAYSRLRPEYRVWRAQPEFLRQRKSKISAKLNLDPILLA